MTTAEKIEAITDTGLFETLGIRTLREIDPDCHAIMHLGINAAGKPISGPVDGFGRVPNSKPSKYVTAAFTTTSRSKLERKWLNTGPPVPSERAETIELGDLIKAAGKAEIVRLREPDSEFIVFLCTNQRLDDELTQKVFAKAHELRVEVRFLDQTRLRDFLDTKPEGQWLRREHLGTDIEQVSQSLLREAAEKNHTEYAASALLISSERIITTAQ